MKSKFRDLSPYVPTNYLPWDRKRAAHLLRRTRIGDPAPEEIDEILTLTPYEAVESLFAFDPLPEPFSWVSEPPGAPENKEIERQRRNELLGFTLDIALKDKSIREKMVYFWSNHFVVQMSKVKDPRWMFSINNLFRKYAVGDIKELTKAVGKEPAMLVYLDGTKNTRKSINENYARELQELFTIGRGNYTQLDVVEAARAFTGWKIHKDQGTSYFNPRLFDWGTKTFYGKTGRFNGDDIVDIIFQRPETARFLAGKLYRHFVYFKEDQEIVDELAALLIENDYNLEPVLKTLLKSGHFMDEIFIGADIKSPIQLLIGMIRQMGSGMLRERVMKKALFLTGQPPFEPPNVAGWEEHEAWISSSTLVYRKALASRFLEQTGLTGSNTTSLAEYYGQRAKSLEELSLLIIEDLLPIRVSHEQAGAIMDFAGIDGNLPLSSPLTPEVLSQVKALVAVLVQMDEYQLS